VCFVPDAERLEKGRLVDIKRDRSGAGFGSGMPLRMPVSMIHRGDSWLAAFDKRTGEMRWNGRKIQNPASFLVPPRVAYTPQVPTLLSGTLRVIRDYSDSPLIPSCGVA
jgi:hypothetical protein